MKQSHTKLILIIICAIFIIAGISYWVVKRQIWKQKIIQPPISIDEKINQEKETETEAKEAIIKSLIPDTPPIPPDPEVIKSLIPDVAPPPPDPEVIKSLIPQK